MSESADSAYLTIHSGERSRFVTFKSPALIDSQMVIDIGNELFAQQDLRPDLHLVLSFVGVQGLSSAMLGKLITLHRRAQRAGRRLVLCEMEPAVIDMFASSRLCDYFTILPTRVAAAKSICECVGEDRDDVLPPG